MNDRPFDVRATDFAALIRTVEQSSPGMFANAAAQDRDAGFPVAELAALSGAGLLVATLPVALGGFGLCVASRADDLFDLLHRLGRANPVLGRVFEAHVNALDLIRRYGTAAQLETAAVHAHSGGLYALWVTDRPGGAAVLQPEGADFRLGGGKWFCSAAGFAEHALITAATPAGARMIMLPTVPPVTVTASSIGLAGMRGAITGSVGLDGVAVTSAMLVGTVADYLREPVFSTAAWRNYAVILGGIAALIEQARAELAARGRADDPFQRMRFGEALIAHETGVLWMRAAARRAEAPVPGAPESVAAAVAYVNLARIASERACLDAIRLVQRSLGVGAFIAGSPVERLARDLSAYLRQPAPDEALDRAAAHHMRAEPGWLSL